MNLFNKYKKVKNLITEYDWIVFAPFLIIGLVIVLSTDKEIDENTAISVGEVFNSRGVHKQYSKRYYDYQFFYNGAKFNGSTIGHISDNVQIGGFYQVEFSDKNPKFSRMIFGTEYVRKLKKDNNGKVIDTFYTLKAQELHDNIKSQIKKFEIKKDSASLLD